MTIQELKDLVLQKISGQGNQIDVGGALPPVLNGILDILAATQNVDSVEVTVDEGIGTPSADVTFTDGVLTIAFHNLKGEKGDKGDQGNTGSSVDYPFELVNNLTTDDATKALSAAQGVVLDGKISQLGQEVVPKTGGEYAPLMNLEQGAIDSSTGQDTSSSTRIRTNGFIEASGISISTSGNKVYVMGYRADGTFVGKNGWITTSQDVTINNAVKYRLVFAYSNDATITPSNFSSLGIDIKANYTGTFVTKEELADEAEKTTELLELDRVYQFVGNNGTMVRKEIKLCPNSYYSVWVDRLYSYGSDVNILGVYYVAAGGNVTLFSTQNVNQSRYDFFTPDGVTDYYIYIRATSGDEVNLRISERTDFTENIIAIPTNFQYSTDTSTRISWDSLIIFDNGTRYDVGSFSTTIQSGALIFDKTSRTAGYLPNLSNLRDNHILLLYIRYNEFVAGALTGYVFTGANNIVAIPTNIAFDGATVRWDSLNIRTKDNSYTLASGEYNFLSAGAYLALNTITGAIDQLVGLVYFHKEHILLLYYNATAGAFVAGCLYGYYVKSQFDGVQNTLETAFKYAYENVLAKSAKRMADIEWTPKAEVITNEGVREAGVTYKGIPYSSVKELQKFVGLDTSVHTFMTAVNNIHSLFYTERVAEYNPNNPQNTRSAYGITYHGENCISYYGNVCSAYVSICLGYPIQYDSWDWLGYYFDLFYSLEPQSEDNIQVGDVLWQPGHCSVVTKITRGTNGELINATISEQSSPISQTTYSKINLYNRRRMLGAVWCRVKDLSHNVFYTPSPFLLMDGENLYNALTSYVYIDSDSGRKFYRCSIPNRRSTFLASEWSEMPAFVYGNLYHIDSVVSDSEKLYKSKLYENTQPLTDKNAWEEIRGIHEWEPYPYVYNNDIVSFAGDRAVYHENDLIYINYTKGNYAQMELYKDGVLIQTLNLSSDSSVYQINVSSYCSDAGMYRARLINGNEKSRFTYFEVVDAELSVSENNGNYLLTFDSQTGIALEAKVVTLSGYPIARLALTDLDRKRGYVIINADALGAAQSRGVFGKDYEDTELYAVVTFAGQWGNVLTNKVSIGVHSRMDGINVYPNKNVDLGKLSDGSNILLAGRLLGMFNFTFMADTGVSVNILSTTDDLKWETSIPAFETGKTYMVEIRNGFAKIATL